jgi:hypothetical protein
MLLLRSDFSIASGNTHQKAGFGPLFLWKIATLPSGQFRPIAAIRSSHLSGWQQCN